MDTIPYLWTRGLRGARAASRIRIRRRWICDTLVRDSIFRIFSYRNATENSSDLMPNLGFYLKRKIPFLYIRWNNVFFSLVSDSFVDLDYDFLKCWIQIVIFEISEFLFYFIIHNPQRCRFLFLPRHLYIWLNVWLTSALASSLVTKLKRFFKILLYSLPWKLPKLTVKRIRN